MLTPVRNWNLGLRIAIYVLAMLLFGLLLAEILYLPHGGTTPTREWFPRDLFLPWLVCFGAGLASMIVVEPFRRPGGSPYGFLLGGVMRTAPPLVLVLIMLIKRQPVEFSFWMVLLVSYFFMLIVVLSLILPVKAAGRQTPTETMPEKNEKNDGTSATE